MTDQDRLKHLKAITDLIRERDLAALSRAQATKGRTEALLRALDLCPVPTAPDSAQAAQVTEKYGLWTTNRRILLNQQHARDTVGWMATREAAQIAFGRSEVMAKLLSRK